MLYIHRNVCEDKDTDVYSSSVHGPVKSLMILEDLTYMTTENRHSYMIS